jgi:ubiquinone biosynthesis protein
VWLGERANLDNPLSQFRRLLQVSQCFAVFSGKLTWAVFSSHSVDLRLVGRLLRTSFEQLGLTYIKLGQFLASRFDLLPLEVCNELSLLFDQVPPMSPKEARDVLERGLGRPVEQSFKALDWEPIASASVAQVHRAESHDGTILAVKIQRPGLERQLDIDFKWLRRLCYLADMFQAFGRLSAVEALEEFATYSGRELNFEREGSLAERIRATVSENVIIPLIYWDLTSRQVLSMQFIEGVSLLRLIQLYETRSHNDPDFQFPGIDISLALARLAQASLSQLFITGLFHADPHPGNIFICDDNKIAFVDFGIVGQLSKYDRSNLAGYLSKTVSGDIDGGFREFLKLCVLTEESDHAQFDEEAKKVLSDWNKAVHDHLLPGRERLASKYIGQMFNVIRKQQVRMSMNTLLFWRALLTLDSSAQRMEGHFELARELHRFFKSTKYPSLKRLLGDIGIHCNNHEAVCWSPGLQTAVSTILTEGEAVNYQSSQLANVEASLRAKCFAIGGGVLSLAICGTFALHTHTVLGKYLIISGVALATLLGVLEIRQRRRAPAADRHAQK